MRGIGRALIGLFRSFGPKGEGLGMGVEWGGLGERDEWGGGGGEWMEVWE